MTVEIDELERYLCTYLESNIFQDYCPNGLQVEGKKEIKRVAFAVSATRESISKAVEFKACALIVHHGLFWKFHGTKPITGTFAKRVIPLIKNDINLLAYHLPLDAHIIIGNAASIAKHIGLEDLAPFGDYKGSPTGVHGRFESPIKASLLKQKLRHILDHDIMHACFKEKENENINSMGIITGGANSEWKLAQKLNLDAYLTGEMSEHDYHESKEAGIHMFAGGHNATETLGIKSLEILLKDKFEFDTYFIKSENPA